MAILKNVAEDTFLMLKLKPINESSEWLNYDLSIYIKQNLKACEFLSLCNDMYLYLENEFTPEVPEMCDAFDSLANEKLSQYSFEPADEREFRLEVVCEKHHFYGTFYRLNLFMHGATIFRTTIFKRQRWEPSSMIGLQMKISKEDLVKFSNQLRQEYEELMSRFK